jgi:hypothetical protein
MSVGVSLLAIGCEAVVKKLHSTSQESRSDFIASKLTPTGFGDLWEQPGWRTTQPAMSYDAVCLPDRIA